MQKTKNFFALLINHFFEVFRYVKYASCFSTNTESKLRGKVTFNYHSIEKGLINNSLKTRFGAVKITRLKKYLNQWIERGYNLNDSQFLSACTVLKNYFDLHSEKEIYTEDIISAKEMEFLYNYLGKKDGGTISIKQEDYFSNSSDSFGNFSNSRHSVRHFCDKPIDLSIVEDVIALARNAPSVCNRQGYKVKFVTNEALVKKILEIQNGLNATADSVKQLFIVTVDRSVFVSPAEWYQVFIDGGIFLQNLLYALHFHQIAAVGLNWSKHFYLDIKMEKLLSLHPSEKIISVVAAGFPPEEFKVPRSTRKTVNEILQVIN